MIVEIDKLNIKSIIIGSNRSLFKNEVYVPDEWGTKEILDNLCCGVYNNGSFSIKEKNIDDGFTLFDIDAVQDNSNEKESEIILIEI
jgi:hypothetical protein